MLDGCACWSSRTTRRWPNAVALGLRRERMAVDVAFDGETGFDRASVNEYDVIVLDRDLPGMHGDDLCAAVLAAGSCRVLMLTAAATTEDLVGGLGLGADDYLAKPFDFAVLVAKIGASARRVRPGRAAGPEQW